MINNNGTMPNQLFFVFQEQDLTEPSTYKRPNELLVCVESERYPLGIVPLMSTTTASPTSICRSDTSAARRTVPLGPLATMMKSTVTCPASRMASATSSPTSRSVRPGHSSPGTCSCTRSIARPARRRCWISAGLLLFSARAAPNRQAVDAPWASPHEDAARTQPPWNR